MLKPIALATAICGTLDILFAMILTLAFGRHIPGMLRFVASGPFPAAIDMGASGAVLGLIVHFALMAIMATGLVLLVRWKPERLETPLLTGIAYGVITYFVMNWLVVPLRFDAPVPPHGWCPPHPAVRAYRAGGHSDGLHCGALPETAGYLVAPPCRAAVDREN